VLQIWKSRTVTVREEIESAEREAKPSKTSSTILAFAEGVLPRAADLLWVQASLD